MHMFCLNNHAILLLTTIIEFNLSLDPPSDTGGSDITTHVLQADVGKGSNTLSICSFKCAVTKATVVGNDPTNVTN